MLDISFGLMLTVAVLFIVLIYLLNQMVYIPLLDFMKKREDIIAEDLKNVSNMDETVKEYKKEAHDVIASAKAEASKMKEEAISKFKAELEKKIEAKRAELEEKYASFLQELSKEKEALKATLENKLPEYQNKIKSKITQL